MKYLFRATNPRRAARGEFIQRIEDGASAGMSMPVQAPRGQQIDMDELVERVYRRWRDDLRRERERERGVW
jgi:hypothetical protein